MSRCWPLDTMLSIFNFKSTLYFFQINLFQNLIILLLFSFFTLSAPIFLCLTTTSFFFSLFILQREVIPCLRLYLWKPASVRVLEQNGPSGPLQTQLRGWRQNKCKQRSISPTCFREAFTCTDPKSTKRWSSYQCLFELLESALVKAARKMLVKFTTGA